MRRPTASVAVVAALGCLLAACGSGEGSATSTTATTSTSAGDAHAGHGSSSSASGSSSAPASTGATSGAMPMQGRAGDVMFAQMMIPHHAQALDLSEMALAGHGASATVQDLARRIQAAQQPEIDQMTAMLKGWGAPVSAGDHAMPMEGMVSEGDLKALSGMQGQAFDAAWVKAMIGHHEGAVSMAEDVLTTTQDPAVKKLAQAIITGQRKEIAEMQAMPTT